MRRREFLVSTVSAGLVLTPPGSMVKAFSESFGPLQTWFLHKELVLSRDATLSPYAAFHIVAAGRSAISAVESAMRCLASAETGALETPIDPAGLLTGKQAPSDSLVLVMETTTTSEEIEELCRSVKRLARPQMLTFALILDDDPESAPVHTRAHFLTRHLREIGFLPIYIPARDRAGSVTAASAAILGITLPLYLTQQLSAWDFHDLGQFLTSCPRGIGIATYTRCEIECEYGYVAGELSELQPPFGVGPPNALWAAQLHRAGTFNSQAAERVHGALGLMRLPRGVDLKINILNLPRRMTSSIDFTALSTISLHNV